jgi:hypothetical protein
MSYRLPSGGIRSSLSFAVTREVIFTPIGLAWLHPNPSLCRKGVRDVTWLYVFFIWAIALEAPICVDRPYITIEVDDILSVSNSSGREQNGGRK